MILPAVTEATSPLFRPVKYALFPPLGLATLAGHLGADDEITIVDEHVGQRPADDDEPDLVVIECYVTSARRCYEIADRYRARGVHVCLGGLHPSACPDEAGAHADTVFVGPGEDTWPAFLADLRAGRPGRRYDSTRRTLVGMPLVRRDLIDRSRYLVPNSLVVSRGCPHSCDFCYKPAFFEGGRGFYTQAVDDALAEIDGLPGRHLYFLDDHLLGDPAFATALFAGMAGMGRVFQRGRHRRECVAARPHRAGRRRRVAQPLRRFRDPVRGQSAQPGQAAQPRARLRGGHRTAARARGDGQRELRLRDGRRRPGCLRAHRGVGGRARHRDRDLPYPHALPGHRVARPDARGRAHHQPRLGAVRHPACGLHSGSDDRNPTGRRLLAGLPGLLLMAQHRARRPDAGAAGGRGPARGICDRLEEARADVGSRHPHPPTRPHEKHSGTGVQGPRERQALRERTDPRCLGSGPALSDPAASVDVGGRRPDCSADQRAPT